MLEKPSPQHLFDQKLMCAKDPEEDVAPRGRLVGAEDPEVPRAEADNEDLVKALEEAHNSAKDEVDELLKKFKTLLFWIGLPGSVLGAFVLARKCCCPSNNIYVTNDLKLAMGDDHEVGPEETFAISQEVVERDPTGNPIATKTVYVKAELLSISIQDAPECDCCGCKCSFRKNFMVFLRSLCPCWKWLQDDTSKVRFKYSPYVPEIERSQTKVASLTELESMSARRGWIGQEEDAVPVGTMASGGGFGCGAGGCFGYQKKHVDDLPPAPSPQNLVSARNAAVLR